MRVMGWGGMIFGPVVTLLYPPGFFWGELPADFPILGPAHPPSHYHGTHPYLLMIYSLYVAWCILLIRGAKDPKANAALFDWGILANILHPLLMVFQAFTAPNEHAHMWSDIPMLLSLSAVCWYFHPNRKRAAEADK